MTAQAQTLTAVHFPVLELTGAAVPRTIEVWPLDGSLVSYQGTIYYGSTFKMTPTKAAATNSYGQPVFGAFFNTVGGNFRISYAGIPRSQNLYVPFGLTNYVNAADPQYQRSGLVQVWNYTNSVNVTNVVSYLLWEDNGTAQGKLLIEP